MMQYPQAKWMSIMNVQACQHSMQRFLGTGNLLIGNPFIMLTSVDRTKGSGMQAGPGAATPSAPSAKVAITALCQALQIVGVIGLDAELVRQAKFDGPAAVNDDLFCLTCNSPGTIVRKPFLGMQVPALWRALHDLVLVHNCGYATDHPQAALQSLWIAVEEEQLLSDDAEPCSSGIQQGLPEAGQQMVIHHLHRWGCPVQLLQQSQTGSCETSSRRLLLALIWLAAEGRLFERALELTGKGCLSYQELLPPYPQASQQLH